MNNNRKQKIMAVVTVIALLVEPCFGAVPVEAYKSYVKGLLAARSGDAEQALDQYQRAAELDQHAVYVYKDIAFSLWQAGKTKEAVSAAEKLERSYSDNLTVMLFLGSFYMLAGEAPRARACWEKVLTIDPDNETAVLYLAAFHASGNEPEKAVSYWNKFIRQEPRSAQAYYQLGVSREKLGEYEMAKEAYKDSVSLDPEFPDAHLSLAQLYEKEEKYTAAALEYERYLELAPDNLTVMLYLGGLYFRMKNFSSGENVFLRAYALNPTDTTVCFWLGIISEEKKDWDNAIKYFEAIAAKENAVPVMLRLSYYHSAKKDHEKALEYLNKVVKLEPDNAASYYMLGLAYAEMKKNGAAKKNFLKAKSLKPGLPGVSFHLGVLYDQAGRFEDAVSEFEDEIKNNPDYAPALNYLGYSYADKGIKLEEAQSLIEKALESEPSNGSFLDSLGWVHFKKGAYETAEKYLVMASEKFRDTVIFEHLGDLYSFRGKTIEAWAAYKSALELDTKNKKVKKKLKSLERLVLPGTLQRKTLKRAVGNLKQLSTLKCGFTASGSVSGMNFRGAGIFRYSRPELWRIDVLGNFFSPQFVVIENKGVKFYPEAVSAGYISDTEIDAFGRIKQYFNSELLQEFDSESVLTEIKGGRYYYRSGERSLVIDRGNGTVVEFKPGTGVIFKFMKYTLNEGLFLPGVIEVYSQKNNVSVSIKLKNCVINTPMDRAEFVVGSK